MGMEKLRARVKAVSRTVVALEPRERCVAVAPQKPSARAGSRRNRSQTQPHRAVDKRPLRSAAPCALGDWSCLSQSRPRSQPHQQLPEACCRSRIVRPTQDRGRDIEGNVSFPWGWGIPWQDQNLNGFFRIRPVFLRIELTLESSFLGSAAGLV